jgi:steroid delta-isomerase
VVKAEREAVSPEQQALVDHVRRFYQLVDAGDIDSMIHLFEQDVVYRRPGYQPMKGRQQLEDFYRDQRVIGTGVHTVSDVVVEQSRIAVVGEFVGVLKDNTKVTLKFADFFAASEDGLFCERQSFFFVPVV